MPTHWTFLLATVSAACLVVLTLTGIFLLYYYDPSTETVTYDGSYAQLRGAEMSKAFSSTLHISFEVRGGLLMRQAHHWAALVLPASLMLHLLSIFFTGGFRRPRRASWVLLTLSFILVLGAGWSGYALPDDSLSSTGLRIVEGITLAIPLGGTPVTWLLFGGAFPGQIITHLYWLHVLVVPLALLPLLVLRLRLVARQRPAQFHGPGRTEDNIVGLPATTVLVRKAGMFLITTGVLFAMAGTLGVAPVWLYGPASPANASTGSQPDWYTGFLDGALRLVPPGWEVTWLEGTRFEGTWALGVLIPQIIVGAFFLTVATYPFLESRLTGDRREHHLLDRPRDAPNRTGLGVAGLVFFGSLWAAASTDVIATQLHVAFETQVYLLRITLVVGPFVAFWLTRRICSGLQDRDREQVDHGIETGLLRREPDGQYLERHAPLTPGHRWRLVAPHQHPPDTPGPMRSADPQQTPIGPNDATHEPPAEVPRPPAAPGPAIGPAR